MICVRRMQSILSSSVLIYGQILTTTSTSLLYPDPSNQSISTIVSDFGDDWFSVFIVIGLFDFNVFRCITDLILDNSSSFSITTTRFQESPAAGTGYKTSTTLMKTQKIPVTNAFRPIPVKSKTDSDRFRPPVTDPGSRCYCYHYQCSCYCYFVKIHDYWVDLWIFSYLGHLFYHV